MTRTFVLDVQGSVFEFKSWNTQVVNIHLPNVWQQVSRCYFYLSPDTNLVIVTSAWVQTQRISVFYVKLCCFSTNFIVWISLLKILLPMYPHFLVFLIWHALYYFIILIHTTYNDNNSQSSYLQKFVVFPFLNIKSLVYLNKSCTTTFCRRGYGLKKSDCSI